MNLAQFTEDGFKYDLPGVLANTVGSSIIVFALIAGHADANDIQQQHSIYPVVISNKALDTQQSSAVKAGLLYENVSTLISNPAKVAIGSAGIKRLESFFKLQSGWDGRDSRSISLNSVADFSNFFDETGFCPEKLGIFMSAQGNVVINWPDQRGQLVELEFHSNGVDYFVEENGEEGTLSKEDLGFSGMLSRVMKRVAG